MNGQVPTRSQRIGAVVVAALAAVYMAAVTVHMMPWSPLRDIVLPITDRVVSPFLAQDWGLFAPSPPNANLSTYLVVRYVAGGELRVTQPIDLSAAVRGRARARRWAPPQLVRVVLRSNSALEGHVLADVQRAIGLGLDPLKRPPAWFERSVEVGRARDLATYRRILSAAARSAVPDGATPLAVRGLIVRTPVRTFAQRHGPPFVAHPWLRDPTAAPPLLAPDAVRAILAPRAIRPLLLFDSGWMDFDRRVRQMGIPLR